MESGKGVRRVESIMKVIRRSAVFACIAPSASGQEPVGSIEWLDRLDREHGQLASPDGNACGKDHVKAVDSGPDNFDAGCQRRGRDPKSNVRCMDASSRRPVATSDRDLSIQAPQYDRATAVDDKWFRSLPAMIRRSPPTAKLERPAGRKPRINPFVGSALAWKLCLHDRCHEWLSSSTEWGAHPPAGRRL